ncbi:MAG: hypothetical protein ACWA41_04960 [Putridiphycobacter sp.]
MRIIFLHILIFTSVFSFAKDIEIDTFLVRKEKDIALALETLRKSKSESEIELNNLNLISELEDIFQSDNLFDYEFTLLTSMSTIMPEDKSFRLFNWNIEGKNQVHTHYCYLVKKGRGKNKVFTFKEDKVTLRPNPDGYLTHNRWYGALYYKIITKKVGNKTFYSIFGYNGNNRSSNKKILDVFWFKGKSLRLGYPLFQDERDLDKLHHRIFFEYSDKATISVKYLADIDKIVFDHLSPETPKLKGMYEYYVPDMTYDAYFWEDGFWHYQADIIVGNPKEKSRRVYSIDPETGEETFKVVPIDWINPVDEKSGDQKDIQVQPENGMSKRDKKKKRRAQKRNNRRIKKENKKYQKNKPQSAVGGERYYGID